MSDVEISSVVRECFDCPRPSDEAETKLGWPIRTSAGAESKALSCGWNPSVVERLQRKLYKREETSPPPRPRNAWPSR